MHQRQVFFGIEFTFGVKIAILPKSKMATIHLRDHNVVSFYWIFKCNASKISVFWVYRIHFWGENSNFVKIQDGHHTPQRSQLCHFLLDFQVQCIKGDVFWVYSFLA